MSDRVMLVITELDPGGAERVLHDLAVRLDRTRFAPRVVSLDTGRGPIGDALRAADVPVVGLNVWRRNPWACAKRLAEVIEAHRPDILHTHLIHANLAGRLAVRGRARPVVISHVHTVEWRRRPWHHWFDAWTARHCRLELCVSRTVRDHQATRTGLPGDFFRVVRNGIDLSRFRRATPNEAEPVVVAVGHLRSAEKGFDVLLRAWATVRREVPTARLIIAGDGPERPRLERLRVGLPDGGASVRLAGYVEDVPGLLASASVACVPSRSEGLPLAPMEAMASGLPVVASRIGAIEELIDDGVQGVLVPRADVDALARGLVELLTDRQRREDYGEQAYRRAREAFGIDRMVDQVQQIYAEALGETSGAD